MIKKLDKNGTGKVEKEYEGTKRGVKWQISASSNGAGGALIP